MKIRMLTSLGLFDARRLDLQASACREGQEVEADAPAAEDLIKRGWAEPAPAIAASAAAAAPAPGVDPRNKPNSLKNGNA